MQQATIRFSIKILFYFVVFCENGYYYLPKTCFKDSNVYVGQQKGIISWKYLYFYIISMVYAHMLDVNCFEIFGNAWLKIHNLMGQKEKRMEFINVT